MLQHPRSFSLRQGDSNDQRRTGDLVSGAYEDKIAPKLHNEGVLVIFSGLPGVGKTVVARALALQIGAVHLRIDSIEQAIRGSIIRSKPLDDLGYRVAYAVAEDNLRIGRTVIADSVNPLRLTRDAWLNVAKRAGVGAVEIEIRCSAPEEHRRRVEARTADIPGMTLPTWQDVVAREYHPWDREHLVVDSASNTVEENVDLIRAALSKFHQPRQPDRAISHP